MAASAFVGGKLVQKATQDCANVGDHMAAVHRESVNNLMSTNLETPLFFSGCLNVILIVVVIILSVCLCCKCKCK